jgi:hypothetical protein
MLYFILLATMPGNTNSFNKLTQLEAVTVPTGALLGLAEWAMNVADPVPPPGHRPPPENAQQQFRGISQATAQPAHQPSIFKELLHPAEWTGGGALTFLVATVAVRYAFTRHIRKHMPVASSTPSSEELREWFALELPDSAIND